MKEPKLATLDGPLKGRVFALKNKLLLIGQEVSCDIHLSDTLASRRHCEIIRNKDQFEVRDLGSTNGTFVNDKPVKHQRLKHGDVLAVGTSHFVFLESGQPPGPSAVLMDEEAPISRSSYLLPHEDVVDLQEKAWSLSTDPGERKTRALEALLKISRLVASVRSLTRLKTQLLGLILEMIPAERGVLMLVNGTENFTTGYARSKAILEESVPVSRTIIDKVLKERTAILSNHILQSEFRRSKSLYSAGVESVLCVPLVTGDKILGLIYLETRKQKGFDEDDLHSLATVSGISALAFENSRHFEWLEEETERLRADLELKHDMVGESPPMQEVYKLISRVATTDATVLIDGESGTGKELAAQAIHRNSPRASCPFVAINCAAISESLLESELFGHEKGAFTGALSLKRGKLEIADRGTLFLDEVGDLAPPLHTKILRFLEDKEFERVGGTRPIRVDIRLIAATNQDLGKAIGRGDFREDLFYRLNVVSLTMPPLRNRREDIPLLTQYFVSKFNGRGGRVVGGVSEEAMTLLRGNEWPGNVRELRNVLERAVVLGSESVIIPEDLPKTISGHAPSAAPPGQFHEAIRFAKKELILNAVRQANGNLTKAAQILALQPTYLHRLIRNLDLREEITNRFKK